VYNLTHGFWATVVAKQLDGLRWYGRRPRPRPHCVKWEASPPKKTRGTTPNFRPICLLWPNGWMDQDTTWYGSRPRRKPHFVRWGPAPPPPPKKGGGHSPHFRPMSVWPKCRPSQLPLSTCPIYVFCSLCNFYAAETNTTRSLFL